MPHTSNLKLPRLRMKAYKVMAGLAWFFRRAFAVRRVGGSGNTA
ncbi:MAG: hypothetical protein QG549_482 [Patescibacteria group bacterium]|nr:hypothetical protein [Patescibacteria group bacterium]